MIDQLSGLLVNKGEHSIILNVNGICYEVLVPQSILSRIEENLQNDGQVRLMTYHYFQMGPSTASPVLIGFLNEIERDFFKQFITVSGIGPKAAVKALNRSISEISRAIDGGDLSFLKSLPGIGQQRAKEIIAKLQGKVGKFGLIQDHQMTSPVKKKDDAWQQEALEVLLQLQYKRQEALDMIQKALEQSPQISSTEELLNQIYRQREQII